MAGEKQSDTDLYELGVEAGKRVARDEVQKDTLDFLQSKLFELERGTPAYNTVLWMANKLGKHFRGEE